MAKKAMKRPKVAQSFSMSVAPQHDKYEIESAANHLERHEEIKSNKPLLRAAKRHLKKKHKTIGKALKAK